MYVKFILLCYKAYFDKPVSTTVKMAFILILILILILMKASGNLIKHKEPVT
jgi:hypothetical protein